MATPGGKNLAHPLPGDEVVITGMAGRFPESDDLSKYLQNICDKKDMITYDNRRWFPTNPEIPHRSGKINYVEKLDAGYFGVHHYQVNQMDPMIRQILERSYEAFLDAGYNAAEMRGSNTGVFVGVCFSETEEDLVWGNWPSPIFGITGSSRSMMPQTISYYFGLQGPSYTVDTACSSSLYALEQGYRAIRQGKCDMALVGGVSLCLNPQASLQFNRLGVLSMDGTCKAFDESANGYARSETAAVVFLQKVKDARRIYAKVVHVKTNSDGYKEQGITFPSSQMQKELVEDTYNDCGVDPTTVDFLEAHATGTSVGDPEEMSAMDQVFCTGRNKPLLIGSIKSYLGHAEGASGMCSLVKVVLGMEHNCILPNIHFKTPRQSIKGLIEGRMAVVTDTMPWPKDGSGFVGVNSFGFGGSNAHAVLKRFNKVKANDGVPLDDLPRLVCASGRTSKALQNIFDDVAKRPLDAEYTRILHQVFKDTSAEHPFRGYIIQSKQGEVTRSTSIYDGTAKHLHLMLPSASQEQLLIGKHLIQIPVFYRTLQRLENVLPILKFITGDAPACSTDLITTSVAIQICLIDLFNSIEIRFDSVLGTAIGTLAAAYAKQELTMEEAILTARNFASGSTESIPVDLLQRLLYPISNDVFVTVITASNYLKLHTTNTIDSLLTILGSIYTMGYTLHLENLYPEVTWPVGAHTPMLSYLIDWNHEEDWFTSIYAKKKASPLGLRQISLLNREFDWSFLPGHVIDGMALMPATGYLYMVWETFCKTFNYSETKTKIVFESVRFHRATQISNNSLVDFKIVLGRETHKFEIRDTDQPIVTGKLYSMKDVDEEYLSAPPTIKDKKNAIVLNQKDFYKELKLRGYNYSGAFCAVQNANVSESTTWIKWEKNWITFIDNMLQTKLMHEDTRNLYVPTFIDRLTLDAPRHIEYSNELGAEGVLSVYNRKEANIITCGGIEIRGLFATAIARRKARGEPVLETSRFLPYDTDLSVEDAVRVFAQIICENTLILKVKVAEVVSDVKREVLAPLIQRSLDDLPLIKTDIYIFCPEPIEVPNVKIVERGLDKESQHLVIVTTHIFEDARKVYEDIMPALKENGYIIAREELSTTPTYLQGLDLVSVVTGPCEKLMLFKRSSQPATKVIKVCTDGSNFDWIPLVQESMQKKERALLVIEDDEFSGGLGFVNCLRREPGGELLQSLIILDRSAHFDPNNDSFASQLKKSLAVNVVQNGIWGSYRHLPLKTDVKVEREHMFNYVTQIGNLSSLRWVEGPLTSKSVMGAENMLVSVHYSAINFKDLTIASGRIGTDAFTRNRLAQFESLAHGFEYSGVDQRGRRIMGMLCNGGSMTTLLKADTSLTMDVPSTWSMEDAATVPVTYGTVLFGLILLTEIKKNQSILIHAGSGGIGQAALNIATYFKCKIFTTVSSNEKRQFILANFPNVPENRIGNSRDTSFEQMIYKQTGGKGVDIVLNSLADEKLLASVRCLAPRGKFIEIGKYDLLKNNSLFLSYFTEGRSFYATMLDLFFSYPPNMRHAVVRLLTEYIELGAVKPLHRVVFTRDEVEQAYRYMAAGKHMGKIVVRVREEEAKPETLFVGLPRFHCDPYLTYVVVGGLGGFGLELVDWLVVRGARKLVLVSRHGVKNGYQASRINIWKSYQTNVRVSTDDVTTRAGCTTLLVEASKLGPVTAIFNLAVALHDNLFEKQTEESFVATLAPKAEATRQLDVVSREFCPSLQYFVVFSSVSCGRGNIGQTSYGMANSIMERICEKRKKDGYPGLAIQWGAIGEVGLVAEMQEMQREIEIGGTLQQRVVSCMTVLDTFLMQNEPIVASMVVAEKRSGAEGAAGILDVIKNIMGITDLKTISEHATLPELGMDSMSALEIKNTLERECEVFLSAKEIRTLTFAKLKEMLDSKLGEREGCEVKQHFNMLHRFIGNEEDAIVPIKRLSSLVEKRDEAATVFVLPGVEGMASVMVPLACNLKAHVYCLQYIYDSIEEDTVESLAEHLLSHIPEQEFFHFVAYSYGCIIVLHLVSLLEARGQKGTVVLLDGALDMFKELMAQQYPGSESAPFLETVILSNLMQLYMPVETVLEHKESLFKCNSLKERVDYSLKVASKETPHSLEYQERVCYKSCSRMRTLFTYQPKFAKIQSKVVLFKPSQATLENYDHDYRIQQYCEDEVQVHVAEGNHLTIVKNLELANSINDLIAVIH